MTIEVFMWALSGAGVIIMALAGFWGKSVVDKLTSIDAKLSELSRFEGAVEARLSDFRRRLDDVEDRLQKAS